MKEASSELSMTAIAVVAIAAIGVVFTTLIWPNLKSTITRNTNCAQKYSCTDNGNGTSTCKYLDSDNKENTVVCPNN